MPDGQQNETRAAQDLVEDAWQVNLKQMFDELRVQQQANQSQREKNDALFNQMVQNAITNQQQLFQQALRHSDIASTTQWRGQNLADAAAGENMENTVSDNVPGDSANTTKT